MKKSIIKNPLTYLTAIIIIGGATGVLIGFKSWAQEKTAESVIECREKFFIKDHRPIYDTIDSLKCDVSLLQASSRRQDTLSKKMYYLLQEMATSDEKTNAMNKYNEDAGWGVR